MCRQVGVDISGSSQDIVADGTYRTRKEGDKFKMTKTYGTCKGCYWEDDCGQDAMCSYYFPMGDDIALEEYKVDLELRERVYAGVLVEQGVIADR